MSDKNFAGSVSVGTHLRLANPTANTIVQPDGSGGILVGTNEGNGVLLASTVSPQFQGSPMLGGSKILALPTSTLVNAFCPPYCPLSSDIATQTNQMYVVTVNVPLGCTITGVQIANGTVASGNVTVGVWNAVGTLLKASSASTAVTGTNALQLVPFTAQWAAPQDVYLITWIYDNSSSHVVAAPCMSASKSLSQGGYALPASFTPPSTTSRLTACPVVGLY